MLHNPSTGHKLGTFIRTLPVPPQNPNGCPIPNTQPQQFWPPASREYKNRVLDRAFLPGYPKDLFYLPSTSAAELVDTFNIDVGDNAVGVLPATSIQAKLLNSRHYLQLTLGINHVLQRADFHIDTYHRNTTYHVGDVFDEIGKKRRVM